jgi:transposase
LAKSQTEDHTMQIKSIGIDLGKTTFHLIALGSRSQVVIRKKFSRSQLLVYTANLPASLIGMEAGVGSHFLGRALREPGHEVRLIPAQFVRPFVKFWNIGKLSIECVTDWWRDGRA